MKLDKEKGGMSTMSRGKYQHHTEKEKAEIAKKALECGIMHTISHYAKIDLERTLSPSTVHTWKAKYDLEFMAKRDDLHVAIASKLKVAKVGQFFI